MRLPFSMALVAIAATACIASSPFEPFPGGPPPTIAQIQPVSASVGDEITITGTGFTAAGNSIKFGGGYINKLPAADPTTIRLTLPSYLSACAPNQEICPMIALPMTPGDYKVSVITANGTSNEVTFHLIAK